MLSQFEFRTQTEVNKSQTQRIGDYISVILKNVEHCMFSE